MKQLCIEISSEKKRIKEVEALMLDANKEFGLSNEQYGKTMIAVTELVMNAIVHGNKEDAAKKVCITIEFDNTEMKITIEDEGGGFIISDLPDPTELERLLNEHGRGVYIAKAMVDKLDYRNKGKGSEFTLLIKKK
ncbi:MAG TPA: ATP-binding protein [Ignavibacteria bacterium]|jgi:serine/threonine-protein kinase RsbW